MKLFSGFVSIKFDMDMRFGGLEGRRKGGQNSQKTRRLNPEHYRDLGCIVAKKSSTPEHSIELAEFMGLELGDGGLTYNQIRIALNSEKDLDYSVYVRKLIEKLFQQKVGSFVRKDSKCIVLYASGVNLISTLCSLGLKVGDKVKLQVDVPEWIKRNLLFSQWCLRGLMDTDGGVFFDRYSVNGKKYCYRKICFTNMSIPLIDFVFESLVNLGFHPQLYRHNKVWLYSYKEVQKYLEIIGSSNNRLLKMQINAGRPGRIEANDKGSKFPGEKKFR